MFRHFSLAIFRFINKKNLVSSYTGLNKLYTYLYHHIVVLDKYIHSNIVYYKHNRDDEPYENICYFVANCFKF